MADAKLILPPGETSMAEYEAKVARGELRGIAFIVCSDDNAALMADLCQVGAQIQQETGTEGYPLRTGELFRMDETRFIAHRDAMRELVRCGTAMMKTWADEALQLRAMHVPAPEYTRLAIKPTESLEQRKERLRRLANHGRKRAW